MAEFVVNRPGIYRLSNKQYHSAVAMSPLTGRLEKVMSKSGLVCGSRSWAHYKASIDFPMAPTPIMEFGTDAHTCVLEFGAWKKQKNHWFNTHKARPEFKGKGAKAAREAWEAENPGKEFLTPKQFKDEMDRFAKIERIREEVFKHPEATQLLQDGQAELSVFWFDEQYQIWLSARPDYLTHGVYTEFKTCPDARANNFLRYIGHLNYHWHSMYLDGLTAITGCKHETMWIIAAETSEPHAVNVFPIDTATMEIGRMQYRKKIKEYVECLKSGKYPAYSLNNPPLRFSRQSLTVDPETWNENMMESEETF